MTLKRLVLHRVTVAVLLLLISFGTVIKIGAAEYSGTWGEATIAPLLPEKSQWALVVIDMATGTEKLHIGNSADKPLIPGSLVKLVTAGALLDHAVANGTPDMSTTLGYDGLITEGTLKGNLYLTGRGNAFLSLAELKELTASVTRQGIKRILGDIVVDVSSFNVNGLERNLAGASQAEAGALGLDLHTMALTVTPGVAGSAPLITVEPPNDDVRIALEARTVALSANALQIKRLDDVTYRVSGNIARGESTVTKRFPLNVPALYAGGTLRTLLRVGGVSVAGGVRKGREDGNVRNLAAVSTPDLDTLLRDMNMNSLNVVADNLLLILGREQFTPPGSREKGIRSVGTFLNKLEVLTDDMTITDGSGLHNGNRMKAATVAHYLSKAAKQPWFERFYATLPTAGMEGTLRDVGFSDQRFRAKTGTLENSYALAGYGTDRVGRRVSFAFIVNHPGVGVMDMKKVGATVMRYLSTEGSL